MNLVDLITKHEGRRLEPYTDSTGHQTVGVGHNLVAWPLPGETYPLTLERCAAILEQDLGRAQGDVEASFPWFSTLDEVRQAVVVDMSFNLGIATLKTFHYTLGAIATGDWATAAAGMLASQWAHQVGRRATEDAAMMTSGLWPDDPAFPTDPEVVT